MRQERLPRGVDAVEQGLRGVIAGLERKADERQVWRKQEIEPRIGRNETRELTRPGDVLADVIAEGLGAEHPQRHPELEAAEPATEGNLPVAIVDHGASVACPVSEVVGLHGEGRDQGRPVGHPERVAVEVDEQPLVWIEAPAVG